MGHEWQIVPFERFGPVAFDMTREDVTRALGTPEGADVLFLHYGALATVGFDRGGRCNWVAISPGRPIVASVDGLDLIGGHDEVAGRLADHGHRARPGRAEEADAGSTYFDDIGVYFGREDFDEQSLATVAAYRRGYWDE